MARLPQFQESGLISANIPQLDFATGGQQALAREQARYSESVTSALDKMSQFAFGKAKEEQELRNKILGIQLRSDLEGEVQIETNRIMTEVKTGRLLDPIEIQNRFKAMSGMAVGLAQTSPEQANGLMASINANSKAVITKASDILANVYGAERDQMTADTIEAIRGNLATVYSAADQLSPEDVMRYESASRFIVMSMADHNPLSYGKSMEKFEQAKDAALGDFASGFVRDSSDINKSYINIINGKTGNAFLDGVLKTGKRGIVIDAAKKQMDSYRDAELARKVTTEREISELEADFNIAMASGDKATQDSALNKMYYLNRTKYNTLVKARDEGGGIFAQYDHGWAIAELSSKIGSVTNKVLTAEDVNKYRGYLTQSTYTEYMNKARILQEAQTSEVMRQTKARLGLLIGNPMNSSAARNQNERIANQVLTQWSADIQANPSTVPSEWIDKNVEKIAKETKKTDDSSLADIVVGRPIRTVAGYENEIRKAIASNDKTRQTQLISEKADLENAIKAGLVDQNGNKTGGTK